MKTPRTVSSLIKLKGSACSFINKETLAQVFSCEFCEISKNTFLHGALLVAASAAFFFFFVLQISDILQDRSRRFQLFFKIGALKNLTILTLKHLCSNLFLIKLHIFMQLLLKYIQDQTYCLDFDGIRRIFCGITRNERKRKCCGKLVLYPMFRMREAVGHSVVPKTRNQK